MAIPDSRASAQKLVEEIANDHGYLPEEDLQQLTPKLRRRIEQAFLKKDIMTGSGIITYDAFTPHSKMRLTSIIQDI